MIHKILETERLIIRPLVESDYIEAFKWCGDERVNKYMIYPLYKRAEDVKKWIGTLDNESETDFDYGFVLKETGELIGSGGMYLVNESEKIWSIGYNLRYDMWRKGLTVEAMREIIAYVRNEKSVRAIEAEFAEENGASGRVMEKLGMEYSRNTEYTKFDGSATFKAKIYRIDF
ncbi:MAG: GNAT family N-acetyltransferase [Clostridiales bacterium]|nr:GNAT family N-acetyltransferase [Clostridiales bacterium]